MERLQDITECIQQGKETSTNQLHLFLHGQEVFNHRGKLDNNMN